MKRYFTPKEVCRVAGVSYRQVQYWDRTKLIRPSYRRGEKFRLYGFADILAMRVAMELRSVGISIQRIRSIIPATEELLEALECPITDARVLVDPGSEKCPATVLVFSGPVFKNAQATLKFVSVDASVLLAEVEKIWPDDSNRVIGMPA